MNYKTMFIDAPQIKEKQGMGTTIATINGDQLSRDLNAAIHEKEREGV